MFLNAVEPDLNVILSIAKNLKTGNQFNDKPYRMGTK